MIRHYKKEHLGFGNNIPPDTALRVRTMLHIIFFLVFSQLLTKNISVDNGSYLSVDAETSAVETTDV